jgi:hypothetical protein
MGGNHFLLYLLQCTLMFNLITFTLIRTNNAPLMTYYFKNILKISLKYSICKLEKSLKFSYDPKKCCIILLCKDVYRESL